MTALMTRAQAAEYLCLTKRTLENHASAGTGPEYRVIGRVALYDPADLDDWLQAQPKSAKASEHRAFRNAPAE